MNREDIIREQRTIEAMKKGLMGLEGKLGRIVKALGEPVYQQGSRYFDQTFLPDPYETGGEEEIPTMEEDDISYEIGAMFDGLSRGVNLSIYIFEYNREIVVRHKGQVVYRELAGELEGYAPDDEWEQEIEKLVEQAKKAERRQKPVIQKALLHEAERRKKEILEHLRLKWGI